MAAIDACSVMQYRRRLRRELSSNIGRLYALVLTEARAHTDDTEHPGTAGHK